MMFTRLTKIQRMLKLQTMDNGIQQMGLKFSRKIFGKEEQTSKDIMLGSM